MTYSRLTTLDNSASGDNVKEAVMKLDSDLTKAFTNLTAHHETTSNHGITSTLVGTTDIQTISNKIITAVTYPQMIDIVKGEIVSRIFSIVGGAGNVRALWIFDSTGSETTIPDFGPNNLPLTLRTTSLATRTAGACSPGFSGLAPYLEIAATGGAIFDADDSNYFSFVEPIPYSIVALLNFTSLSAARANVIFGKGYYDASNSEYLFLVDPSMRLCGANYSAGNYAVYMGRYAGAYNMSSQAGAWHTYAVSYSGVAGSANLKLYNDGVQIDNTNFQSGSYVGMANGSSKAADYYLMSAAPYAWAQSKYSVLLLCSVELSAHQMRALDYLLRAYAGVSV